MCVDPNTTQYDLFWTLVTQQKTKTVASFVAHPNISLSININVVFIILGLHKKENKILHYERFTFYTYRNLLSGLVEERLKYLQVNGWVWYHFYLPCTGILNQAWVIERIYRRLSAINSYVRQWLSDLL